MVRMDKYAQRGNYFTTNPLAEDLVRTTAGQSTSR